MEKSGRLIRKYTEGGRITGDAAAGHHALAGASPAMWV